MYLTKISVRDSAIEGKGVFATEDIRKNSIVWKFDHTHDQSLSPDEFDRLDTSSKTELLRVAYLSPNSNRWVFPPDEDPARFTNHSEKNNLSVVFDDSISEEPIFIANKDIRAGDVLTVNYSEFDARTDKAHVWD
jgi:SET domain-containing protein